MIKQKNLKIQYKLVACIVIFTILLITNTVRAKSGKGLIWKVTSSKTTIYLLGSMHFAKKDMYPFRSLIEQAFKKADYLVVEVNIKTQDPLKMQQMMLQYGTYPKNETLMNDFLFMLKYSLLR